MQQIKVYVTSKRRHAPQLLSKLRAVEGIHVVSRWMDTAGSGIVKPSAHWMQENFDDIVSSHVVLAYAELGDTLRIAIGEAFYALAHNKPIFAVGQYVENAEDSGAPGTVYHPAFADWTSFPLVRRTGDLSHTIAELRAMRAGAGDRLDKISGEIQMLTSAVHELKEKVQPSPSRGDRTS